VQHGRLLWANKYNLEQLVLIDESGVDDLTNVRQYGWAPLGQASVRRTTFLRSQKYLILPALSLDGIMTVDIFEGSVNRERFLEFLQGSKIESTFIQMAMSGGHLQVLEAVENRRSCSICG
jgi:DDE superfamily endonuclease